MYECPVKIKDGCNDMGTWLCQNQNDQTTSW